MQVTLRGVFLANHVPTVTAAVLGSPSVLETVLNFARPVIYTTAPSFPMIAAIRAGYTLMKSGETQIVSQVEISS